MKMDPLGSVCEFRYGKGLPELKRRKGAFPVFGSNGVVGNHDEPLTISPTIIIGRKGSIGEINYSERPCWPIDTTYFIDQSATKHDLRWLFYALSSLRLQDLNKATGVPGLNRNDAYECELFVPQLDEQRRIALILDKAEAIHRKQEQALNLAENFVRSVFLEMFGDPIINAKGLPKQPLGKFGKIVTGNTPPRSDTGNFGDSIEWIKSDNVNTEKHFLTKSVEGLSDKGKALGRVVPDGSILVTCIAGSPSSIGRAAIADRPVAFNQQINAITPNKDVNLYFLYAQFLVGKSLVLKSSTNSMKGMISKGEFQKIEFLCPDPSEQKRFGMIFEKHIVTSNLLCEAADCSTNLFGTLSQRAFAGEL